MGLFTQRFTEAQERAILSIYFTNPFGDISFIIPSRDFGPEEIAANNSSYSRSHLPYQERFLRQIAKEPNLDMDFINRIVEDPSIINKTGLVGDVTRAATHKFHTRWSLGWTEEEKDEAIRDYGDGSIRDSAMIHYHIENTTDLDGKNITWNPKSNPQVKSTRYLDWKLAELSKDKFESHDKRRHSIEDLIRFVEENPDVQASRYSEEIVAITTKLFRGYEELTDRLSKFIERHSMNGKFKEFYLTGEAIQPDIKNWINIERKKRDDQTYTPTGKEIEAKIEEIRKKRNGSWPTYARKTVFDFTRYLLTSAIPTSLANSEDVNSFGLVAVNSLSSSMKTAQEVGRKLMEEGAKVCPTLLGEKTHIQKSDFMMNLRETLSKFAKERFEFEKIRYYESGLRVKDLSKSIPQLTDIQLAVSMLFPYTYGSSEQILDHFSRNPDDMNEIVEIIKGFRGKFDPLPRELLHGGLMKEVLIDLGADRDLQRHRRGFHNPQLICTYLGYETPELFVLVGLEERYKELITEADNVFRKIVDDNPHVAQLVVPFAYRRRRQYTFGFGQDAFLIELRSRDGAHFSYADAARTFYGIDKEKMPLFSELVRVNYKDYPQELINLKQAREWYNKNKRGKENENRGT